MAKLGKRTTAAREAFAGKENVTVTEAVALQHDEITENPGKVTPLVVLHSIRYLQENYTNTANMEQRLQCEEYLCSFVPPFLVDIWLDTYQALEQLASSGNREAA